MRAVPFRATLPMATQNTEITRLISRWSGGDQGAFSDLVELAYPELRAIARRQIRRTGSGRELSTTVLVHEAYIRLAGTHGNDWPDRVRFYAFCAKVMRHVLIDVARKEAAAKRGGGRVRVTLTPEAAVVESQSLDLLALNEALERLQERNGRMAEIVECRFFAGLSVDETAEALGSSPRTVAREWTRARLYLQRALAGDPSPGLPEP